MAYEVINNFNLYNNLGREYSFKEKLFKSWKPHSLLLMFPREFEDEYDMNVLDIVNCAMQYSATGEFDQIPIVDNNIGANDALEFARHEDFVKYWIRPDKVIRLEEDLFWFVNQIPTGEIAIISSETILEASIFTAHCLFTIDPNYNNDEDDSDNSTDDSSNNEIDTDDVTSDVTSEETTTDYFEETDNNSDDFDSTDDDESDVSSNSSY